MRIWVFPCILCYYKVYSSHWFKVGHNLIGRVHCIDASMPEHEALLSSHKMCLQTEAINFFALAKI